MTKLPAIQKPKRRKVTNEELWHYIRQLELQVVQLRSDLISTFHDECCHKMHKISKELGNRMIEKLSAEDKARRHTLGEL